MAAPAPIYVVNQSTTVSDADTARMTAAVNRQLGEHVAPAWGRVPIPVVFAQHGTVVPRGGWVIVLLDTLDEADAAGWHTDDGPQGVHGVVGTKVWLDHGGSVLSGPNSVAVTLSHEVAELFCDVHANGWADTGRGWSIALEVCDPVEGDAYLIDGVSMSNFVTPDYFDPSPAPGARLDYLGRLRRPFTMTKGGYFVYAQDGQAQQKFGEHVPDWIRELKAHTATRIARVGAGAGNVVAVPA